ARVGVVEPVGRQGPLPIRYGDRQPRLTLICLVRCIDPKGSGDGFPQRVVPVAVRGIEVAACVASTTRVYARGAVLLQSGIELRGYRLVCSCPLGVAAAEDGVRQVRKRLSPCFVHPVM